MKYLCASKPAQHTYTYTHICKHACMYEPFFRRGVCGFYVLCTSIYTIKGAEAGSKVLGCAYAPQRSIHKDAHCGCVCVCVCFMIAPVSMTRCMINHAEIK